MRITAAVEGPIDELVVRRVLAHAGHEVVAVYAKGGKDGLDRKLNAYNAAARYGRWLVLRDLDHDADCAPELLTAKLPAPAPQMLCRIAVREVEAWLLGDAEALADFLGISTDLVPADPEILGDPKQTVINLARRSRRREIRHGMVPAPGTGARLGIAYTARLTEYILDRWRPEIAAGFCPSLQGCLDALERP